MIIHLYTFADLIRFVAPIQLRAPQTSNFFGIFLPFIKPFPGEKEMSMDIPVTIFLDLCGITFSKWPPHTNSSLRLTYR